MAVEADEHAASEFLPDLLLAFQKILTGVRAEDGFEDKTRITSTHDRPDYEPLESIIDQLDRFFDPFRTDPEFLDWLASWVALELRPDWTHAEKRKMIARMVRVVKRVGLKSGLYDFLDIYAKEQVRPRIVIDDDEALFRIVLNDDGSTSVNVLAYASLEAWGSDRQVPFLYRPTAIAVNPHADPAQVRTWWPTPDATDANIRRRFSPLSGSCSPMASPITCTGAGRA